ncbi:unnamed protein product (macronuclear) [Paramecium tetraurelia]|uniref:tRNA pseudouridine(55) synthase n=1 Tax=Paramecium tetraurelia TaxID=5888 RepID=A0BYF6_PARTE|nr:uncharacterized protein GSPATT00033426001 [Paramecium tetraurelia]CAK63573.1 unnamed protein product [Paramecium tetraurelia]|eukprot:XP_001430971.1 hypothetical protein (macronuclear) [Paramecium tetraurelia strain d4-2]
MQINEPKAILFNKLYERDVCIRCILRLFKITEINLYRETKGFIQLLFDVGKLIGNENKLVEDYDLLFYKRKAEIVESDVLPLTCHSSLKDQFIKNPFHIFDKINKCVICQGILQCLEDQKFYAMLVDEILQKQYQYEAFKLQVKTPVGQQIRQILIVNECISEIGQNDPFYEYISTSNVAIDIKACVKWIMCNPLSESLKVPSDINDDRFQISLNFESIGDDVKQFEQFKDIIQEIDDQKWQEKMIKKLKMNDPQLKTETENRLLQKKNQQSQTFLPTQNNLEKISKLNNAQLSQFKIINVNYPVKLEVTTSYQNIFIQGNYIKLGRYISQTPWYIGGNRIYEDSVEDLVSAEACKIFKSSSVKFHSGGREDIDVRMLGNGRPFAIELVDPHLGLQNQTQEILNQIESKINSQNVVKVTPLTFTDTNIFGELKNSEINKVKAYCCVVECKNIINGDLVQQANQIKDLVIKQKTPIRVLHRRTQMVRDKIIHSLLIKQINEKWLQVYVLSSAGTYIKEFIHSDLDRTVPNLCSLLQNECDIYQLDVIKLYEKIDEDVIINFKSIDAECGSKV